MITREVFISVGRPYPIARQEHCFEDAGESIDPIVTGEFTSLEIRDLLGDKTCIFLRLPHTEESLLLF